MEEYEPSPNFKRATNTRKSSKFFPKRNIDKMLKRLPTGELAFGEKLVSSVNIDNRNNNYET